jgi:gluconate 2-dehydrogenase gamma chain
MKRIIIKKIHSRRHFINNLIGAGLIINLPFVNSCKTDIRSELLNIRQKNIIDFTFIFLYPNDNFGPDLKTIKTIDYLYWVLSDNNVDPEENQYMLNGLNWVDETAIEEYGIHFEKLKTKQKFILFQNILKNDWGENWLSKMLTIIIESMFADPIYGSNPESIVWKWLNHNPGQPRPNENNKYPIILNRKMEKTIFTNINQL